LFLQLIYSKGGVSQRKITLGGHVGEKVKNHRFKASVGSGESGTRDQPRVFDYAFYCRTWAGLLCKFVPPHTSL